MTSGRSGAGCPTGPWGPQGHRGETGSGFLPLPPLGELAEEWTSGLSRGQTARLLRLPPACERLNMLGNAVVPLQVHLAVRLLHFEWRWALACLRCLAAPPQQWDHDYRWGEWVRWWDGWRPGGGWGDGWEGAAQWQ